MVLHKWNDVVEQDLYAFLDTSNSEGIKIKKFSYQELYDFPVNFRHLILEPGKSYPTKHYESTSIIFIVSGRAYVEGERENYDIDTGDVLFIFPGEHYSITNTGNETLIIICCYNKSSLDKKCSNWPQ